VLLALPRRACSPLFLRGGLLPETTRVLTEARRQRKVDPLEASGENVIVVGPADPGGNPAPLFPRSASKSPSRDKPDPLTRKHCYDLARRSADGRTPGSAAVGIKPAPYTPHDVCEKHAGESRLLFFS